MRLLIAALAALIGFAGSTTPAGAEPFSASARVIAILADNLFVGVAEGHLSGAGTVAIHSQENPNLTCVGKFTSSAERGGSGQLQCSNGTTAEFHFRRLSLFRGNGVGSHSRGSLSFVYGLTADEAKPYLKLPEGKKFMHNGTALALVNR
jgi:hypothetical protein